MKAFAGFVLFVGLVACEADPIVLASVNAAGDADERPDHETRCLTSADCLNGFFCQKHACGEIAGHCSRPPTHCASDTSDAPVCGCDGVTYFNDCLRRAASIEGAAIGACDSAALLCGRPGDRPCPGDAVCARLNGSGDNACDANVPGACWVLPAICPSPTSSDRWNDCAPDGGRCADTCFAARTERPFRRTTRCL